MQLTVTVTSPNREVQVNTLEELFDEISKYDPDMHVWIQFVKKTETYEHSVSATVDP